MPLGISKYSTGLLRENCCTLNDLLSHPPSEASLQDQCAITALGSPSKLLSALPSLTLVSILPKPNTISSSSASAGGASTTGQYYVGDRNSRESTNYQAGTKMNRKTERKTWAIFKPGYSASTISPAKSTALSCSAVHDEQEKTIT